MSGLAVDSRSPPALETRTARDCDFPVRRCGDIADIAPSAWDAILDRDDLQATHRFITVCQRSGVEGASYRHLLIGRGGDTIAIATFCRMEVRLELLSPSPLRAGVRWGRRWFPGLLRVPVAFCGLPVSFGQSCLRVRPGADRAAIAAILARELDTWADDAHAGLSCFKEFAPEAEPVVRPLVSHGYFSATSLPSCHLDIRWPTFGAYVGAMRAGYRRQVAATLRARAAAGLDVRVVADFGPLCPQLFALYEQIMDRAPYQLERLNLAFFERLNADLGMESGAVLVEHGGRPLAAAILLYSPRVVTFLLAGIDYELNRRYQAYPNLVIEVVAEAIRRGAQRLEMGQTSYDLKLRFGAVTTPRTLYLRHRGRLAHGLLRGASRLLFPEAVVASRRVHRQV